MLPYERGVMRRQPLDSVLLARLCCLLIPSTCNFIFQVYLCGSFTRWVETIPMAPVEGSAGAFAVVVHLPPGWVALAGSL